MVLFKTKDDTKKDSIIEKNETDPEDKANNDDSIKDIVTPTNTQSEKKEINEDVKVNVDKLGNTDNDNIKNVTMDEKEIVSHNKRSESGSGIRKEQDGGNKMFELVNKDRLISGDIVNLVRSHVSQAMQDVEIQRYISEDTLVMKYSNNWDSKYNFGAGESTIIINKIPSLVKMTQLRSYNDDSNRLLRYQENVLLKSFVESSELFSPGTRSVFYTLESSNLPIKVEFPLDEILQSMFNLPYYVLSTEEGHIESNTSRKNLLLSIISTSLKIVKACDVCIQKIETITIGNLHTMSKVSQTLADTKVPVDMPPHLAFGLSNHNLSWFVTEAENVLYKDGIPLFKFGRSEYTENVAGTIVSEYHFTSTDSLFATLHFFHMRDRQNNLFPMDRYINELESLSPLGGCIYSKSILDKNFYQVKDITETELDQFIFSFFLVSSLRLEVFNHTRNVMINANAFITIAPTEIHNSIIRASSSLLNTSESIGSYILTNIRGIGLDSFFDMIILNMYPEFFQVINYRPHTCNNAAQAIYMLISIGLEAILFPAVFWSNPHIYGWALFNALGYLDHELYTKEFADGFHLPKDLKYEEVLSGIIPHIFVLNSNKVTKPVRKFMNSLRPIGQLVTMKSSGFSKNLHFEKNLQHYIPWVFVQDKFLSQEANPFIEGFRRMLAEVSNLVNVRNKSVRFSSALLNTLSETITNLNQASNRLGVIIHHEGALTYKVGIDKPLLMLSTYKGAMSVPEMLRLGVASSDYNRPPRCISREKAFLPFDIGLWMLYCLSTPDVDPLGSYVEKGQSNMLLPNPLNEFNYFFNVIRSTRDIGQAFGLLNLLLSPTFENDEGWSFLRSTFGNHLRSSTASHLLKAFLDESKFKDIKGEQFWDGSTLSITYDNRIKDPRICTVRPNGSQTPMHEEKYDIMKRKLELMSFSDQEKFKVALNALASETSPFHRIGKGLLIGNTLFGDFSPENRHCELDISIEYEPALFTVERVGQAAQLCFNYNNELFFDVMDPKFPKKIEIVIITPSYVQPDHWDLIASCVERIGWQVLLPDVLYIAKVINISPSSLTNTHKKQMREWDYIREWQNGTVQPIYFLNTKGFSLDIRTQIRPANLTQAICSLETIEKNVLVRGIDRLDKPTEFVPPMMMNWCIGNPDPKQRPAFLNNIPKTNLDKINFNNAVKVYSENVSLDQFPDINFIPPRVENLSIM